MSEHEPPDHDLNRLLEEKGYLTSPVGRWFRGKLLESISSGRGILRVVFQASLATSVILSALLTAAVLTRVPHPSDLLIFFYYLIPLAAAVFMILLITMAFLWLTFRIHPLSHPLRLSHAAGLISGIASAFILWMPLFGTEGTSSVLRVMLFTILTYLSLIPALKLPAILAYRRSTRAIFRTRPVFIVLVLSAFFVVMLFVLFSRATGPVTFNTGPPPTIPHFPPATALIIVDGVPLHAVTGGSELRNIRNDSYMVPFRDHHRGIPAVNWTEILTGFPPRFNGIHALEVTQFPGISVPFDRIPLGFLFTSTGIAKKGLSTNINRTCPLFWEWCADAGIQVNAVNCWSSWPPWSKNPRVISNLALLHHLSGRNIAACQPEKLSSLIPEVSEELNPGPALDRLAVKTFWNLENQNPGNLSVLYLSGMDIHLFETSLADLEDAQRFQHATQAHLRFIQDTIAEAADRFERFILILHPGRGSTLPAHILFYPARRTGRGTGISSLDITPLLLALHGLPIHEKMSPVPATLPWAVPSPPATDHFPKRSGPPASRVQPPIEELRSLGYLQ